MTARSIAIAAVLLCLASRPAGALETDQFTVPSAPLVDLGPPLSRHVLDVLDGVARAANARHADLADDAAHAPWAWLRRQSTERAAETLSPDYLAARVYEALGRGLPDCEIERWLATLDRGPVGGPLRLAIGCDQSVYGAFWQRPLTMQELSPTVNVYGVYCGTDKVGHLFQQGYEYYKIYRDEESRGRTPAAATAAAVKLGVWQELGIYGEAMVGVYSNGDLAANFAGLKFYLNLTRPLSVRGTVLPPVLVVRGGKWQVNDAAGRDPLRPFVTDHLNESMNPCRYAWMFRDHVRAAAGARGASWVAFYRTTRAREVARARALRTWDGEEYGHSGFAHVFTAADVCFGDDTTPPPPADAGP